MSTIVEPDLHALATVCPAIDTTTAERICREHFGVEGRAERQPSERDANFRLHVAEGPGYVLRIAGEAEDADALELEMAALAHLERHAPTVPVPRIVAARGGERMVALSDEDGRPCSARMLGYLPGRVLAGVPVGAALARELGDTLARLDDGLRGFFHRGADRRIVWNLRCAPALRAHVDGIAEAVTRETVAAVLERAEHNLLPRLEALRAQVIHADANSYNVLVDEAAPARIAGIIDFGDCSHAPRVAEVAIAAADLLLNDDDPVATTCAVLAGYHARAPLEEADLAVLHELCVLRIAVTLAVLGWRRKNEDDPDGGLDDYASRGAETLQTLLSIDAVAALRRYREACGMTGARVSMPAAGADTASLVARRHRVLGARLELSYARPLHVVRGEGVWLHEADGSRCLDAYNNVPHVGHSHPRVAEAVARQVALLNTNTRYLYDIVLDYAERLVATLPAHLSACVLVNSGSEANDVAWRIAKTVSGRDGALVMRHAYHGITDAIDALAPYDKADDAIAAHVRTLGAPDRYRGRHRGADADIASRYAAEADAAIDSLRDSGHGIAAFMVDPGLCSEGMLQAPDGYLSSVAARVHGAGGLVIADEVQSGFGRMGDAFWGHLGHAMEADMVTMGKPIANGIPLGAIVMRPQLLAAFTERVDFFSTFGGNPVACAAGAAVLSVTADEGLQANARATGAYLLRGLRELMGRHALIGDVRGRGLMIGVELVRDRDTLEPAAAERIAVMNALREHGVLVGADGPNGNVLKIRPPMPFGRMHADRLLETLDAVLWAPSGVVPGRG